MANKSRSDRERSASALGNGMGGLFLLVTGAIAMESGIRNGNLWITLVGVVLAVLGAICGMKFWRIMSEDIRRGR